MTKKKTDDDAAEIPAAGADAPAEPEALPEPPVDPAAPKRFAVQLAGHASMIVEAVDEADAKAKYNAASGIIRSDHAYTIVPAAEG